jgi:maltose phosphorylase
LDLDDYNKEIKQGLHITSMGGTWMSIVEGFAGLKIINNKVYLNTKIPKQWESYSFKVNLKNRKIKIKVNHELTSVKLISGDKINIVINDTDTYLKN